MSSCGGNTQPRFGFCPCTSLAGNVQMRSCDLKMPAIVTLLVKKLLKPGNVELRWKYPASIRILPLHEPGGKRPDALLFGCETGEGDRKSTRLNSSHLGIS